MLKIPRCMSTQHPDNVHLPFFAENAELGGEDEIQEAYYAFSHLGCDEQMWDCEGKEVDNFVVKKLLTKYEHFFREKIVAILLIVAIAGISIVSFLLMQTRRGVHTIEDFPAHYISGPLPEDKLLAWNEPLNTDKIYQEKGNIFICRETGKEAEKVEFYSHSAGSGFGGWRYRYALVCGNYYWILDAADPFGTKIYGPFKFGEEAAEIADYEVHEWGVLVGCSESKEWFLTSRPEKVLLVKQPVIYVHAKELEDFNIKVIFNGGRPTQTYPLGEISNNVVEWKGVKIAAESSKKITKGKGYVPLSEIIPKLNVSDADRLEYKNIKTRFLFYEGEIPFENKIEVKYDLDKKKVVVKNNSKYEVYDLTVSIGVEDKNLVFPYAKRYIARIEALAPGMELSEKLSEAERPNIQKTMERLGFTQGESYAFAALWEESFFMPSYKRFARLSYRLPRGEIERLIRLEFEPKPKKLLRELWVLVDLESEDIGSGTGIVRTCSSNAECDWVSTNCCPENAGAHWQCINAKLSKLDCPVNPVCLQVISPKPEKACKCINGICTMKNG